MEHGDSFYYQREIKQPRMQWNLVLNSTLRVAREAIKAGIDPSNLVFTGGIAVFLHIQNSIGLKAVNRWRGTHDVDLIVTEKGGVGKILAGIIQSNQYEYIEPLKSHFPNKHSWKIQNKGKGFLAGKDRSVEVDVYFTNPDTNQVKFNDRLIEAYPKNFITSQIVKISIGAGLRKLEVSVPNLLDCLIMKLDIAAINGKLRNKDKNDVLSLLMASEKKGIDSTKLIIAAISEIKGQKKLKPVIYEIETLLTSVLDCLLAKKIDPEMRDFIPSEQYLKECKKALMKIKNSL